MTILKLLLAFALGLFSLDAIAQTLPQDIPLSFPFFQSGQSSGIREQLMVGYGDYCDLGEQLHMGIDFLPESETDQVLNPFSITMYSIGADYQGISDYTGCIIGIGPKSSDYGWAIEHLGPDPIHHADAYFWCQNHKRDTPLTPQMPIDTCCNYSTLVPLHTHIQWSHWVHNSSSPGGYIMPNPWYALVNPMDFFTDSTELAGYDQVMFNNVWAEHDWYGTLPDSTNTGMFFLPDGVVNPVEYNQTLGAESWKYQDIIHGAVDIAVATFSMLNDYPDSDSCGVRSVGYEILLQNPISHIWEKTESIEGKWGYRELFRAEGQIEEPSVWLDIYYALFFHKGYFLNTYMITNSGEKDPSTWNHGWDNVWIDPTNNDWVNGICRGAWDTNLHLPPDTGNAQTNAEAFFPDGRYAVRVTAVSHGSRDTDSLRLPVDDLSLPEPQTEGVVVDNFQPHIVGVAAYTWNPAAGTCHKIFEGYWEDIAPAGAMTGDSEYLERLRADLHALQSEDRSYSSFPMPSRIESSSLSFVSQIGFSESARTSEEYSDILRTLESGCCLDEGIGQDPLEFLMEEITRIENQRFIDVDTTRVFDDSVYCYLPRNGLPLVLQVFYSEPTMTENLEGVSVFDNVYFKSCIGPDSSYFNYPFRRLSSDFELPLSSDAALNSELESGDVLFNSSYVVHYIYKNLPPQYMGNIRLYFGSADLQDDEGPRDLAGNQMDSYPGTAAESRSNYGPFSNIGLETGPDINYVWEPPNWFHNTSTDIVHGFVGSEQDFVAAVNLNSIGLADCVFLGDCDYWCGFWMLDHTFGVNGFDVYIVKPDGTKIPFHFSELSASWGEIQYPTTSNGRYLWLAGFFGNTPGTTGTNAIRIDAESGSVYHQNVCRGYSWTDGPGYLSAAQLVEVFEDTDRALFHYGYFTIPYDPESGVSGYDTLPSSSTHSNDLALISEDIEIDLEVHNFPILEIQGNPISSNLGIICNSSTAQEYELVIYDIAGRRVLVDSGVFTSTDSRVDIGVSNLPSGVYLLKIRTGDTEVMRTISIIH